MVNGTGAHCPRGACKSVLPKMAFGTPQPQARKARTKSTPVQISALQVCDILVPHPQRPPDLSWGRSNLRGPWQAPWKVRRYQEEQQQLSTCGRWHDTGTQSSEREAVGEPLGP